MNEKRSECSAGLNRCIHVHQAVKIRRENDEHNDIQHHRDHLYRGSTTRL